MSQTVHPVQNLTIDEYNLVEYNPTILLNA
jgi:hypothetical protein